MRAAITPSLLEETWIENEPLADFANGFFFNSSKHLRQQTADCLHGVSLRSVSTGEVLARCAFGLRGRVAQSPMAAPFGSIEFDSSLTQRNLEQFVDALIEEARLLDCQKLRLVHPPHCYAPRQAWRLTDTLTARGFTVTQQQSTAFIPVQSDDLVDHMHAQERRRLRKAQRAGLVAGHWSTPCIPTVLSFIEASRKRQGYPLTLPLDTLGRLLRQFPTEFPVFVVWDCNTIAALCVCVRVRADILYYFLPADNAEYRAYSPAVTMIDGLYRYSRHENITLLDLGVSIDTDRQPKLSLAQFKRNMGAITSPKLTFEISF